MKDPLTTLATAIARDIFRAGDWGTPCQRIQFMGGTYPDAEIRQGGFNEAALTQHIKETLQRLEMTEAKQLWPADIKATGWLAALRATLADAWLVLRNDDCWSQNHPYCPTWDAKLNDLMTRHRFERESHYTAIIGDARVWVANHPYASFTPVGSGAKINSDRRPKRSTILRAHDKLIRDTADAAQPQR